VEQKDPEQHDPKSPEKPSMGHNGFSKCPQTFGVVVERFGSQEDLQVAEHMHKDKKQQDRPGERHDCFLSDGRSIEPAYGCHT
jgi:hypothetical protein